MSDASNATPDLDAIRDRANRSWGFSRAVIDAATADIVALLSDRRSLLARAEKAEAELEATRAQFETLALATIDNSAQRDALATALELILPLSRGYASEHRVGSNQAYVESAERTLDAARANAAVSSWQPIDTAPETNVSHSEDLGSPDTPSEWFEAFGPLRGVTVIRRVDGVGFGPWEGKGEEYYRADQFTHWKPLPAPPAQDGAA